MDSLQNSNVKDYIKWHILQVTITHHISGFHVC